VLSLRKVLWLNPACPAVPAWRVVTTLVVLANLILASEAAVAGVSAIYSEAVPVASQSQADRRRAAGQGLSAVLVRVAGTTQVLQNGSVRQALAQADSYLEQFSYQSADADSEGSEAYQLLMEFQPETTTALLRDANLPVWSSKRPVILAWIELSDGASRNIVTRTQQTQWAAAVMEEARRRGLPIVLPNSALGLNASDVAEQMRAELLYRGFVRTAGPSCSSQWTMELDGAVEQWSFNGDEHQQCVARAVDELAETLSARYAFAAATGVGQTVMLQVAGIRQFEDYSAVLRMLGDLAVVRSVAVHSVAEDRVRFALQLRGSEQNLDRAIRLEQLLVVSEPQQATLAPRPTAVAEQPVSPDVSDSNGLDALDTGLVEDLEPVPSSTLYYRLAQPYGGG
jgi:hypothetical protein